MSSSRLTVPRNGARYAAPAAACAGDILRALRQHPGGMGLAQLERSLPRTKSLIFRVLRELEASELVARDDSGLYRLGIGSFELGAAYISQLGSVDVIRDVLQEMANEVGEAVSLGVLRGNEVLYLMKFRGPSTYVTISRVGGRVPANCVAIGKALLALLPDDEVRARFPGGLPAMTPKTVTSLKELTAELNQIRATGVAIDREQAATGRCGLAVTLEIDGLPGEPVGLSASMPVESFDPQHDWLVERILHARDILTRDSTARVAHAKTGAGDGRVRELIDIAI